MVNMDKYWSTKQVADHFGVAQSTVRAWRLRGVGPPYERSKNHKMVRYLIDDVLSYEKSTYEKILDS